MKKNSVNIRKEITSMDLINTSFISKYGILPSTSLSHETINKRIFVETFTEVKLKELFAPKIFGQN